MRLGVDITRCQGHARCSAIAPELFELDELGYVKDLPGEIPAGMENQARRGVAACPERALAVR